MKRALSAARITHLSVPFNRTTEVPGKIQEMEPKENSSQFHAGRAEEDSENQMQPWKCMEDSIAISMLLAACQSMHSLQSLVIQFTHVGTWQRTVRGNAPSNDPFQDISRIYSPMWCDLQELLHRSLSLR